MATVHRKIRRVGGSVSVIIPKDFAEAMEVGDASKVRMTLVGRQLVIEPEDDTVPRATFRRAFATVLRRYAPAFRGLAEHDKS